MNTCSKKSQEEYGHVTSDITSRLQKKFLKVAGILMKNTWF